MGSQIAGAIQPLQSGLAVTRAIETGWILYNTVAALAFLYYRMTRASVVITSILSHEDALRPLFYCLTNHGYHLPSELKYKKNPPQNHLSGFSLAKCAIYVAIPC